MSHPLGALAQLTSILSYPLQGGFKINVEKIWKGAVGQFARFFYSDWRRAVVFICQRLSTNQNEKSVQIEKQNYGTVTTSWNMIDRNDVR